MTPAGTLAIMHTLANVYNIYIRFVCVVYSCVLGNAHSHAEHVQEQLARVQEEGAGDRAKKC